MKIENVEKLHHEFDQVRSHISDVDIVTVKALDALRAEAWHPIEKAEELGAKDGRWVLALTDDGEWYRVRWHCKGWRVSSITIFLFITHFRFIVPPEGD